MTVALDSGIEKLIAVVDAEVPPPPQILIIGKLESGQSVADALKHGLTDGQVAQIVNALKGHYDFRRARPGTRYLVEQDPPPAPSSALISHTVSQSLRSESH